jgi:hypothetical protein
MLKNFTRLVLICLVLGAKGGCCGGPIIKGTDGGVAGGGDGGVVDNSEPICPGNYRYVWPASNTTSLVAIPLSTDATGTVGELHFIAADCKDTKIGDKVVMASVQVNLKSAPSAIFIGDGNVDSAMGKFYWVDLSVAKPTATALGITGPFGGSNIYYGAAGDELLALVPPTLGAPARTTLTWAKGAATTKPITSNAATIVFSPDRTWAVVADNVSANHGALISVKMSTGDFKNIAMDASVTDDSNHALFTVAGDTVAFLDTNNVLKTVSLTTGAAAKTIESGILPKLAGLSPDGTKIAYFVGDQLKPQTVGAAPVSDLKFGSADGSDTPVKIGSGVQVQNVPVKPVVSPDKKAVLYFSQPENRNGYSGTAWITSTAVGSTPIKVGDKAPISRFTFGECGLDLIALTGVADLNNRPDLQAGLAGVSRVTSGASCAFAGTAVAKILPGAYPPMATSSGVHEFDFTTFQSGTYVAFLGGYQFASGMHFGTAYVASISSGDPTPLTGGAVSHTLEASPAMERVLYIGNASVDGNGTTVGDLMIGYIDGSSTQLLSGVVDAHFTPDGHVFAIANKGGTLNVARITVP